MTTEAQIGTAFHIVCRMLSQIRYALDTARLHMYMHNISLNAMSVCTRPFCSKDCPVCIYLAPLAVIYIVGTSPLPTGFVETVCYIVLLPEGLSASLKFRKRVSRGQWGQLLKWIMVF